LWRRGGERRASANASARLRLQRKLSQRALATPGVSFPYLSRIENGVRKPSLKTLRLLAPKLGVSVEYLETGDPITPAVRRELRLHDAELELRLGRDLPKAETVFRDEIDADVTEPALLARAQAGLGLLAARRGDNDDAIVLLEAATESGHPRPEARPDLYETLARCYVTAERTYAAIWLFRQCLDEVRERAPDDAALEARFATYLAAAHARIGQAQAARDALAVATKAARAMQTPQARTQVYWVEGVTAWTEGRSETGLMYLRRAIGLLEAGDDALQLARAHMIAGRMLNLEERYEEAADHLERAGSLFALGANPDDLGVLRAEEAKLAAARGDADEAAAYADEAAALLDGHLNYRTNVWHARALAHAAVGETEEAERYFRLTLDGLTENRQWREAAQVARQWARLLQALDRDEEALKLMERATGYAVRGLGERTVRARDAR
jgi:transcriptional regulator with XRE-family HTH domain